MTCPFKKFVPNSRGRIPENFQTQGYKPRFLEPQKEDHPMGIGFVPPSITKHFRYLKWRYENLYRLYGWGLCNGKLTPK